MDGKVEFPFSTLYAPILKAGRRMGNTTRQIDYAIQCLFQGHKVKVVDHVELTYDLGEPSRDADMYLMSKIRKRLELEHPLLIKAGMVKIDTDDMIIELRRDECDVWNIGKVEKGENG